MRPQSDAPSTDRPDSTRPEALQRERAERRAAAAPAARPDLPAGTARSRPGALRGDAGRPGDLGQCRLSAPERSERRQRAAADRGDRRRDRPARQHGVPRGRADARRGRAAAALAPRAPARDRRPDDGDRRHRAGAAGGDPAARDHRHPARPHRRHDAPGLGLDLGDRCPARADGDVEPGDGDARLSPARADRPQSAVARRRRERAQRHRAALPAPLAVPQPGRRHDREVGGGEDLPA